LAVDNLIDFSPTIPATQTQQLFPLGRMHSNDDGIVEDISPVRNLDNAASYFPDVSTLSIEEV
jgi:hypothetical protein